MSRLRSSLSMPLRDKNLNIDDDALNAVRHPEACILDIAGLFAEYGPQQFFFGGKLRFAFPG